jgi:hypothetical protein
MVKKVSKKPFKDKTNVKNHPYSEKNVKYIPIVVALLVLIVGMIFSFMYLNALLEPHIDDPPVKVSLVPAPSITAKI